MSLTLVAGAQFANKLRGAAQAGPQALVAALYQEAQEILTIAKERYVPVDTGALRASGFVEPPTLTPNGATMSIGFGGPSAPYAVIVHEDLTKRHRVGEAKYLEIPLRARIEGMQAVLSMRTADGIRQAFQRLGKIEANVGAGRDVNWGMPLWRS